MEEKRNTRRARRAETAAEAEKTPVECVVTAANGLNLRVAPTQKSPIVRVLALGTKLSIENTKGEWGKVKGGWVMLAFTSYNK